MTNILFACGQALFAMVVLVTEGAPLWATTATGIIVGQVVYWGLKSTER